MTNLNIPTSVYSNQRTYRSAVDDTSNVDYSGPEEIDQLKGTIKDQREEIDQLKGTIKNQSEKISNLEKSLLELTEKINQNSKNVPTKNILFDFENQRLDDPIIRKLGFNTWDKYKCLAAYNKEVTIEFASHFPKKFTVDIKGNSHFDDSKDCFEIHIGTFNQKRHKKEFQLSPRGWGSDASILFETEDGENNTMWIVIPARSSDHNNHVGMYIQSINIIPRS